MPSTSLNRLARPRTCIGFQGTPAAACGYSGAAPRRGQLLGESPLSLCGQRSQESLETQGEWSPAAAQKDQGVASAGIAQNSPAHLAPPHLVRVGGA